MEGMTNTKRLMRVMKMNGTLTRRRRRKRIGTMIKSSEKDAIELYSKQNGLIHQLRCPVERRGLRLMSGLDLDKLE